MAEQRQVRARRIDPLCSVSELAIAVVLGPAGGIGKTTIADAFGSYIEANGAAVQMVRVETGVRRREFACRDIVVDIDGAGDAALLVGGEAALFEDAWPAVEEAIARRGTIVFDGGANTHRPILGMAAAARLAQRVTAARGNTIVIVVSTPDPEGGRQAVALVQDAADRMPGARIMLAISYVSPSERAGLDTPQARAFAEVIAPIGTLPRIVVPFARAQSLAAFARSQKTPLEILRATDAELLQLTGAGTLATLSAHAHFGAWWTAVIEQLERYFPAR